MYTQGKKTCSDGDMPTRIEREPGKKERKVYALSLILTYVCVCRVHMHVWVHQITTGTLVLAIWRAKKFRAFNIVH